MTESIATAETPLMTVEQAAKTLHITSRTLYSMIAKGEIRSYKVAGARRIAQADIDTYLKRQSPPSEGTDA